AAFELLIGGHLLVDLALVEVALNGDRVVSLAPVDACAALNIVPAVIERDARRRCGVVAEKTQPVAAPGGVVAEGAAIPEARGILEIARLDRRRRPERVAGLAGDDVDHAVHGIGAPQRGA